jgi:uncharacterized membrane protein YesL
MTAPGSPTNADDATDGPTAGTTDGPTDDATARAVGGEARRPSVTTGIVWFLVIEGLLAATTVPTLVWLLFLEPRWSNVPLMVALGIPVGPALSAALFAWRRFSQDHGPSPAQHFWRGYQLNWADALRIWVPALAVVSLLAVNLVTLSGSEDAPVAFAVVGVVAAVLVAVWTAHAMLVVSLFSFRMRDVVRVAVYFVLAKPRASLGALVIVAAGVAAAWFVHPWLPVALGSVLTSLLWRNGTAIAAEVERRFVAGAPEAPQAKPWPGLEGIDLDDDADGEPAEGR